MSQKLRGLVAQGVSGRKSYHDAKARIVGMVDTAAPGSGSFTTAVACQALIYLFGPGGSAETGSIPSSGAGAGAALFKRARLGPGQTLSWTCGAPGAATSVNGIGNDATDTTLTGAGLNLRAGGGKGGGRVTPGTGGLGGVAFGGDINRAGGQGGSGNGTSGQNAPDPGGGIGGTGSGSADGGGGAGGFGDDASGLAGGSGSNGAGSSTSPSAPGGGTGGTTSAGGSLAGANGRVYILFLRLS